MNQATAIYNGTPGGVVRIEKKKRVSRATRLRRVVLFFAFSRIACALATVVVLCLGDTEFSESRLLASSARGLSGRRGLAARVQLVSPFVLSFFFKRYVYSRLDSPRARFVVLGWGPRRSLSTAAVRN